MDLRSTKSVLLPFTLKRMNTYNFFLNRKELKIVKCHRFLALVLDRSLTWNPHIAVLEEKETGSFRYCVASLMPNGEGLPHLY